MVVLVTKVIDLDACDGNYGKLFSPQNYRAEREKNKTKKEEKT